MEYSYPNVTWNDLPDEIIESICNELDLDDLEASILTEKRIFNICKNIYDEKLENKRRKQNMIYGQLDYRHEGEFRIIDYRKISRPGDPRSLPRGRLCETLKAMDIIELLWYLEAKLPYLMDISTYSTEYMREYLGRDFSNMSSKDVKYYFKLVFSLKSRIITHADLCRFLRVELFNIGHILT